MKFDRVDLKSDVLANAPQRSSIHAHSDCFVALIASIFNKELNADICAFMRVRTQCMRRMDRIYWDQSIGKYLIIVNLYSILKTIFLS